MAMPAELYVPLCRNTPFGPVDESEGELREEASELGVSWAEILTSLPYLVAMLDLVGPNRG